MFPVQYMHFDEKDSREHMEVHVRQYWEKGLVWREQRDFISWKGNHVKYFNYYGQLADAAILCRRCDGYFRSLYGRMLQRPSRLVRSVEKSSVPSVQSSFDIARIAYVLLSYRKASSRKRYLGPIASCDAIRSRFADRMVRIDQIGRTRTKRTHEETSSHVFFERHRIHQIFAIAVLFNEAFNAPRTMVLPLPPSSRIQIVHLTIIKLFHRHPSRNARAAGLHRVRVWRQNFSAGSLCLRTPCRLWDSLRRPISVIYFPIMGLSVGPEGRNREENGAARPLA
jgi:hypothetical protein